MDILRLVDDGFKKRNRRQDVSLHSQEFRIFCKMYIVLPDEVIWAMISLIL